MDCWTTLGIEQTTDEELIKQAYHEKLPLFHPEDDPEGFRRLRQAYEEALAFHEKEAPEEDLTPTGLMVKELIHLYNDFAQRINPDAWAELLNREICQQIDTQQKISEKLLLFLTEEYYIPHPVWKLLAGFFCWEERQEELKKKLPPNFIDYVLGQSKYDDLLRYDLLPLDAAYDYDQFITKFYHINRLLNSNEFEQVEALFAETDLLGIEHLDYSLLKLRYYVLSQQQETANELAEQLVVQYPEDIAVIHGVAQCLLRSGKAAEALPLFEKVVEKEPQYYSPLMGIAHCYYDLEDYAVAKEKYRAMLLQYPYDGAAANGFYAANEKLIPIYEAQLAEEKDNQEIIYKLASCYHNCHRFADGETLLAPVTPTEENAAKHHDFYAYALTGVGKSEEAFEHFLLWEALEEPKTVAGELPHALINIDQDEVAWQKCETYLEMFPEMVDLYSAKARICFKREQWGEALEMIEQGLALDGGNVSLLVLKSEVHYRLECYSEALESSTAVLDIYPSLYSMMLLQIKIYHDVENYEDVLAVCDRAESYYNKDETITLYRTLANLALRRETEEMAEFLQQYLASKPGESLAVYALKNYYEGLGESKKALAVLASGAEANPDEIYFRIEAARLYRLCENLDEAMEQLVWIDENRPVENSDIHNEKGLIYERWNDLDTAAECYEKAIEVNDLDRRAYGNLAGIYAKKGEHEKAIEYYTKQLSIRIHPYYYISRGLAYGNLKQTEKEKEDYLKTIEVEPDYAYAYNNLGVVFHDEGNFEEALPYLDQALERDRLLMSSYQFAAKCLARLTRVDEAFTYLQRGIEIFQQENIQESQKTLYQEKLRICRTHMRYQEGLTLEKALLQLDGMNAQMYRYLGYCAYEQYEDDKAMRFYNDALEIEPNSAVTYRQLAHFFLYGKKKLKDAYMACAKAIELDPGDADSRLLMGQIYLKKADKENAVYQFTRAKEIMLKVKESDRCACTYFFLGEIARGLDELEEAKHNYQKALEMAASDTNCPMRNCYEGIFALAQLYADIGEIEEAERYFQEGLNICTDREYKAAYQSFQDKRAGKKEKKGIFSLFRKEK